MSCQETHHNPQLLIHTQHIKFTHTASLNCYCQVSCDAAAAATGTLVPFHTLHWAGTADPAATAAVHTPPDVYYALNQLASYTLHYRHLHYIPALLQLLLLVH